jgi:hypothetical protein
MARSEEVSLVRLWEMDAAAVLALVGTTIPLSKIVELFEIHGVQRCTRCLGNPATVYRLAVRHCQRENPFSRALDRALRHEFAPYILEVRGAMMPSLRASLGCEEYLRHHLPGVLCGLLYCVEPGKRSLGEHLAYSCIRCGLCNLSGSVGAQTPAPAANFSVRDGFNISLN